MSSPGCRKLVQRWKTKHRYWSSRLRLLITSFTQTFWTSSMTMKLIFFSINRSIWWTCSKITWIMVLILRGKNVSRPCNRYCFTFYRLPCSNNKIVYTLSSNEFLSPLKSSFTPVTISEYVTVCRGRRALLLISSPPRCLLPPLFTSQQGKPITICTGLYDLRAYQMHLCGALLNRLESNQWAIYKLLRSRPCCYRERNLAGDQVRSTRPTHWRNHPRPSSLEDCEQSLSSSKLPR